MFKKIGFGVLGVVLAIIAIFMGICMYTTLTTFEMWASAYGALSTWIAIGIFLTMIIMPILGFVKCIKGIVD